MEIFILEEHLLEISTLVQIGDNITIVFAGENIMAFQNILMVEFF